jgi:transcriptional regulator with XRE-family HTH domain
MDQDWGRLGEALKAARAARTPKLRQEDVAASLGISRATLQKIERGDGFAKVTHTIRAYARLVGWTSDSPERVLAGDDPQPAGGVSAEPEAARPLGEGLPMTVQDELERKAAVVDTEVIQLPDGTHVTVIVKGASKNPSPEERANNLRAWRRVQGALRELSYPTGDDSAA